MIELKVKNSNLLIVLVPDTVVNLNIENLINRQTYLKGELYIDKERFFWYSEPLPSGKWNLISDLENIEEERCKSWVNGFFKKELSNQFDCFENYYDPKGMLYTKNTAKESFKSLIQKTLEESKVENINNKTIYILQKI